MNVSQVKPSYFLKKTKPSFSTHFHFHNQKLEMDLVWHLHEVSGVDVAEESVQTSRNVVRVISSKFTSSISFSSQAKESSQRQLFLLKENRHHDGRESLLQDMVVELIVDQHHVRKKRRSTSEIDRLWNNPVLRTCIVYD